MNDIANRSNLTLKKSIIKSVGRLIRGLSALFWGLPVALLSEAHTDLYARAREMGILLPLLTNGMLIFGLVQIGKFQSQERIWSKAVDRSVIIGILNLGLTPFLFFWHDFPRVPFYSYSVALLFFCGLLYLYHMNFVLKRLAFMIPDETLRHDTELFSGLNRRMLSMMMILTLLYHVVWNLPSLPTSVVIIRNMVESARPWLIVFMVVMPVAMTMTMVWKIKEILLDNVYDWSKEINGVKVDSPD
ncbi:MAG: hypothetical protein HOH33_13885 [Verrucomicrobia bacterium]|jgi:hypothetical protein|nr:hypothetical protein [Verrucomicrobiota bacterium]